MATATAADKKGMKRICPTCSTRYYDFNKRPVVCPNCKTEFTADVKAKVRRRNILNDIEDSQVSEDTANKKGKGGDEDEDDLVEGDEGVVSLEDAEPAEEENTDDEAVVLDEDDADLVEDDEDFDEDDDEDFDEEEDEEDDAEDDDGAAKKPKKKR